MLDEMLVDYAARQAELLAMLKSLVASKTKAVPGDRVSPDLGARPGSFVLPPVKRGGADASVTSTLLDEADFPGKRVVPDPQALAPFAILSAQPDWGEVDDSNAPAPPDEVKLPGE